MVATHDPDWAEIDRRARRLRIDASRKSGVGWPEKIAVIGRTIETEVERVVQSESFLDSMPPSPGVSHGVGTQRRDVMILIDIYLDLKMMTRWRWQRLLLRALTFR